MQRIRRRARRVSTPRRRRFRCPSKDREFRRVDVALDDVRRGMAGEDRVYVDESSCEVSEMVEQTREGSNPFRAWMERAATIVQAVFASQQVAWGRA
jgi:hypothetical protein